MPKKMIWDLLRRKTPKKKDPLGKTFSSKKSLTMPKKTEREDPLVLSGIVYYAGKIFWFSSLGQQVQFGVILKCCRTFGSTILVTSGVSNFFKTLMKGHDYSRLDFQ